MDLFIPAMTKILRELKKSHEIFKKCNEYENLLKTETIRCELFAPIDKRKHNLAQIITQHVTMMLLISVNVNTENTTTRA